MPFQLTPQRQSEVETAIRKLAELDDDIAKAERCDIDCQLHKEQARRLREQLEAIRREFGKGR